VAVKNQIQTLDTLQEEIKNHFAELDKEGVKHGEVPSVVQMYKKDPMGTTALAQTWNRLGNDTEISDGLKAIREASAKDPKLSGQANKLSLLFGGDEANIALDNKRKVQQQHDIEMGKLSPDVIAGKAKQANEEAEARKAGEMEAENRASVATNAVLNPPVNYTPNPNAVNFTTEQLQQELKSKGIPIPDNFNVLYNIAHNMTDPKTLPPNPRKGSTVMDAQRGKEYILKYINPSWQEGDYKATNDFRNELAATGKPNTAGGILYNAGVASQHLDLLEQAGDALNNHDLTALNRIANKLGVATGSSAPVVFGAIADAANGEVAKVVAGGKANEPELQALREKLNQDQSPEQTKGVVNACIGLMNGRVNDINEKAQQYLHRDVPVSAPLQLMFNKHGFAAPGAPVPPTSAFMQNGQPLPNGKAVTFKNGQTWTLENGRPVRIN
jgi:hypothetical protein